MPADSSTGRRETDVPARNVRSLLDGLPRLDEVFAFAFCTAFVRQALWLMPGKTIPVVLSAVAGLAAAFVVRRSRPERPAPPAVFWWAVALPVLAFWGLRASRVDIGYDVLNYHLMHGERGLWGPIFPPGDFYPFFFPYLNPAADLVTAMFRAVLGYRGGTVVCALALVWSAEVLWRLLTPHVRSEKARALAVLLAVASEGMLWEVSGYMVDLLSLPVLLEATRMATEAPRRERPLHLRTAVLGLLLGAAVALKLTNLVFAVPIGLVALVRWFVPREGRPGLWAALGALAAGLFAAALPVAPHALLLVAKTGNPVFPYFNALFKSPFFPEFDMKDLRWGPTSRWQALVWPVLTALHPERLSEFGVTSGRLALGWLAALVSLVAFRKDPFLRSVSAVALSGGVLWSMGTGYHRYGLFAEILGGLVLTLLVARVAGAAVSPEADGAGSSPARVRRVTAAVLLVLAGAQSARAVFLALRTDWSGRPTLFHVPADAAREALQFFRDRDLRSYLSPEERKLIPSNVVWVDAMHKVNGIMTLLDPDAPMLGLLVPDYLALPLNMRRLDAALAADRGRTACSLAFVEDVPAAESALARFGFPVKSRTPLSLPFFSHSRRLSLVVFEVTLPPPLGTKVDAEVPTPWTNDVRLRGSIDEPIQGQEVQGDLKIRGWAHEPGEDLLVTILVRGGEVRTSSFRRVPRPDVASVIPEMGDCSAAGYEAIVPYPGGLPDEVDVSVVFRSRSGKTRYYPAARIRWKPPAAEGAARP